jgi:hypothetical protein
MHEQHRQRLLIVGRCTSASEAGVERKLVYFPREVARPMGIFDKAKDALSGQEDKIDAGVEKTGDMVDEKTEDKYAEHVDQGQEMARDKLSDTATDRPEQPA